MARNMQDSYIRLHQSLVKRIVALEKKVKQLERQWKKAFTLPKR